jgi:hypothetical protein
MIYLLEQPAPCALTKNSMLFRVKSSQFFPSEKIYPKIRLEFAQSFSAGYFFEFAFVNPETLGKEYVRFRTLNSVANEGDVQGYLSPISLATFTTELIEALKGIKKLNSYYDVVLVDNGKIDIVAKEAIEELIPQDVDENLNEGLFTFTYTISSSFNDPSEREGYQMKALVFYNDPGKDLDSLSEFELISTLDIALDENAEGFLDVSELINGKIESEWDEIPIPPYSNSLNPDLWFKLPNLRQYYVQFKEFWNNEPVENQIESSRLFAHWGGISTDDEVTNEGINHILTAKQFLTWIPSGKFINKGQIDFLYFMNDNQEKSCYLKLNVWTNFGLSTYIITYIDLKKFQSFGFFSNIENYINNPNTEELFILGDGEKVIKYEFQVYQYNLEIEDYNDEPACTFLYYYEDLCQKKYILYFNSFGVAESFSTNATWKETMNVSREVASRGLLYNNSHLRAKNFTFSSQHQNSIILESSMMKRLAANRLQSMINSTYAFIFENERWIPAIIETTKQDVFSLSNFVQTIELELLKANSSDRASFFPTLPSLEVQKNGYGLDLILLLNGLNISAMENLFIYNQTGAQVKELIFDDVNFKYAIPATPSDWETEMLVPGIYSYKANVTLSDGTQKQMQGVFEYKYEQMSFLLGGTGTKTITLASYNTTYSDVLIGYNLAQTNANLVTVDIHPTANISPSYARNGFKRIYFQAPSFEDVNFFQSNGASIKDLNLDAFYNLKNLNILNQLIEGTFYLNRLSKLENVNLVDTPITALSIGFLPNILIFAIDNLDLDEIALEDFIREFWNFRKMYGHHVDIYLTNTVIANAETLAMINGTGIYAGDGLVNNDFTVTITP